MIGEDLFISEKVKKMIWEDASLSAKFYPYLKDQTAWIIHKPPPGGLEIDRDDGFPIPPQELWAGYGENVATYLSSGRFHFEAMIKALEASGFSFKEGERILDFGCAAGRMTRCFKYLSHKCEVWGVDVRAEHILWCQLHLSPPFKFVTTTTFPHLPFEDNYFSMICAGSVFTHISDLADTWLMELKRILRPGGRLYVTIHDNRTIEIVLSSPPGHWLHETSLRQQLLAFEKETNFMESGFSMFVVSRQPGDAQVFHDIGFLRENWGRFLKILSIVPEAYGYQTAVILSK